MSVLKGKTGKLTLKPAKSLSRVLKELREGMSPGEICEGHNMTWDDVYPARDLADTVLIDSLVTEVTEFGDDHRSFVSNRPKVSGGDLADRVWDEATSRHMDTAMGRLDDAVKRMDKRVGEVFGDTTKMTPMDVLKSPDKDISPDYVCPSDAAAPDEFCASGWVLPDGRWVAMVHGEHVKWALANGYRDTSNLIRVRPCPTTFRYHGRPDVNAAIVRYRGKMIFEWERELNAKQIDTVYYLCRHLSREQDWQRFKKAVEANQRGTY
jgi:hypothetical protein